MKLFLWGLRRGFPVALGYFSVSFTFGIMAVSMGFPWWQAVVISMTTVTSAGQLAGLNAMVVPGQYMAMLVSQITINLRYSFMSISLSQKVNGRFGRLKRWLLGFFMTDEIFAIASSEKMVDPKFFFGLSVLPYIGWAAGTLSGALIGNVLPPLIMNALCLAIYGMFLAIVVPPARKSRSVLIVVLLAGGLHTLFYYLPYLRDISSGISISICAVIAALLGAFLFPINEESEEVECCE